MCKTKGTSLQCFLLLKQRARIIFHTNFKWLFSHVTDANGLVCFYRISPYPHHGKEERTEQNWLMCTQRFSSDASPLLALLKVDSSTEKCQVNKCQVGELASLRKTSISSRLSNTKVLKSFDEIWFSIYLAFLLSFTLIYKNQKDKLPAWNKINQPCSPVSQT